MDSIVVIGGGGHAKVIISILKKIQLHKILGYTDIENKGPVLGIPYLGNDKKLREIFDSTPSCGAAIGIGMINKDSVVKRKDIISEIEQLGFKFPPIISSGSCINEEVVIKDGTVIMDGVVVNTCTTIGKYAILNTCCSVDHDCNIGDFTHIAPSATILGDVTVEDNVFIGASSLVYQGRSVVDNSIIGAGSIVRNDITESGVYAGIPAQKIG